MERFQVIAIASDGSENVVDIFDSPRQAADAISELRFYAVSTASGVKYRIKKVMIEQVDNDHDKAPWKCRERARFLSGEYEYPAWQNEEWFKGSPYAETHFCHVSMSEKSMIAFTPDVEFGVANRHLRLRPGKYLQRYFSNVLASWQINDWANRHSAKFINKVQFAESEDAIEDIYMRGPDVCGEGSSYASCMRYHRNYFQSKIHPSRVYAAGDLRLAYIEGDDIVQIDTHILNENDNRVFEEMREIVARALVYDENKTIGRVYGKSEVERRALIDQLKALGYSEGSLEGAALLKVPYSDNGDNCYIMPYLDHCQNVSDNGEYFIIDEGGEIECTDTCGYTMITPPHTCHHCGEVVDDVCCWYGDERYCHACHDELFWTCDDCGYTRLREEYEQITVINRHGDEAHVCERCLRIHYRECTHCGHYHYARYSHLLQFDTNGNFIINGNSIINGNFICHECITDQGLVRRDGTSTFITQEQYDREFSLPSVDFEGDAENVSSFTEGEMEQEMSA